MRTAEGYIPAEPAGAALNKGGTPGVPMMASRLPSLSQSLQIMALVVFAVIVGVTYRQLEQLREATLAETHRQMARLDMVMAEQTSRAMETVEFILRGVIEQQRTSPDNGPATRDALRRQINGVRQLLAVEVADAQGKILVSTRASPGAVLPPAGMALVARYRAEPALGTSLSEPIRQDDGSWTTLMTQRIEGPDKRFDGVAVGFLNVGYFEDFYKSVDLSENGAIILHRRDGLVLARYPHDEQTYGQSYANLPPFRDVLSKGQSGTIEMESPADSGRRILAIRALKYFPLAVNVSVDEGTVLAAWRRQTWIFALSSLGFALLIAGLMLQLARRSREMQHVLDLSLNARAEAEAANARLLVQMEERERAEAALRQSQRVEAVGQLTGGVAHDFNNLLTILLGNIELMQTHPAAAGFGPRLTTMRAAAERGAKLTSHLLAFARRQPLMPRSVDLGALIRGMEPLLASALGTTIKLVLDIEAGAPAVHVDPTQVELIVLNVAMNAREAMPAGGMLRIATSTRTLPPGSSPDSPPAGIYVRMRLTDTGKGMSQDTLIRAFEPYFSTKPLGTGSGLGLSQVYGIARQSGGQARIESKPGAGTTVEIDLPCLSQPEASTKPMAATTSIPLTKYGSRATLLLVDDDPAVRTTTSMLLRRSGYHVTEAEGGEQALSILGHDGSIELLVSDVVMPRMNGIELARAAVALRPGLPVMFLSGYSDQSTGGDAIPVGRLLRKPFRPAELINLIEVTLAESRAPAAPQPVRA
jgi:signal transduction histidine kinase/ActR/RegA family two-component response regulator